MFEIFFVFFVILSSREQIFIYLDLTLNVFTLFRLRLNHLTKTRFFRAFRTPVGAYARRPAPASTIDDCRRWLSAIHRTHNHRMGGQALFGDSVCMREAGSILTQDNNNYPTYLNLLLKSTVIFYLMVFISLCNCRCMSAKNSNFR